eukprot:Anaeramoba_ignava/c72599_g1_i1.p1 GENE.c72599_g1_i1~~c72599_g1_i1.p1  ORF type:complete len:135 (+),score=6.59 c72599_g1_i1:35-439(+)
MALFVWDDSFSVGINSVDKQHKKLMDIINRVHEAMVMGKSDNIIQEVFKELIDYTHEHFGFEEKYFDMYKYPDRVAHKRKHKFIFDEIDRMSKVEGKGTVLSIELMQFLTKWLTKHIKGTDKEYSSYMISKGMR